MYKLISAYQSRIEELAPLINSVAQYVPRRRARKLHIGLFGYSRNVKGKAMPRAIPFAAAFYSLGIPPGVHRRERARRTIGRRMGRSRRPSM